MDKAIWRIALLAGLLAGNLVACAAPAADTERAALETAIHRWVAAVNAQDVATLNASMTADVELSDGAATATGRDAAIRTLRGAATRGKLIETTREIKISGDLASHTAGLAHHRQNGVMQAGGQVLENWKRVNGEWKLDSRKVTGAIEPDVSVTRPSTKEPVLDRPKD
jgi:ketosteroid isomerase-like protein